MNGEPVRRRRTKDLQWGEPSHEKLGPHARLIALVLTGLCLVLTTWLVLSHWSAL